jgi:hypothetical protein
MKHLFKIYCVIFHFIIHAQAPSKFYQRFGGTGYDVGYDVKQTLDSGYIITGSTSSFGFGNTDLYVAKLDKMGQIKFQKSFGNFNNECGKSIVQLIDSSYVMLGYTNSSGFGGYDIYLVKIDKNGNLLWQKNYGGSDWDFGNSLQKTSDGGFIIAGTTYSFGRGDADGYIIKTDALGNVTWTKTYGGLNDDEFKSVIQTADGGYALTGYTKSYLDNAFGDVWTFKLDALGDSVWCKFYGGVKEDFGNCIVEHPSGDMFIAGATASIGNGLLDGYAIKINNLGNQLNHVTEGTNTFDEIFNSITISKRNNIITVIEKEKFGGYKLQLKLMELNLGLSYINATDYGSIEDDEVFAIIPTFDKGYACTGSTLGFGSELTDVYFIKADSMLIGLNLNLVGISNNKKDNISFEVFPNPASSNLFLKINADDSTSSILFYNSLGELIDLNQKLIHVSNKEITINIGDLINGFYYLRLGNNIRKICIIH